MSSQNYFLFDEESSNFIPVEYKKPERFIYSACIWIIGGVILCGLGIGFFSRIAGNPSSIALRAENKALLEQLRNNKITIKKYQQNLKKLARNDNDLYRSVLGMKSISPGEREGGSGGADIYSRFNTYGKKTSAILKWTAENLEKMKHTLAIQQASYKSIKRKYASNRKKFSHIPTIRPTSGPVTSGFGMRFHPILKIRRMHKGIDFAVRVGHKVYATGAGVVKMAARSGQYGKLVVIDNGYGYETYYAHLSAFAKGIEPGATVRRGQKIAYSGNTGLTTGPHLHYEVHKKGKAVDPLNYLLINVSPAQYLEMRQMAKASTKSMD